MVNSESHSSNDQVRPSTTCSPHEDGFEQAAKKLLECALTHPKTKKLASKVVTQGFKDADLDDEEGKFSDYMKGGACKESFMEGGACKESFMALSECPDGDKQEKQMAMMDCMEAHSDYYHKYNEIIKEQVEKEAMKELESTFPGGGGEWLLGVHELFTEGEGGCCKEQYMACVDRLIEESGKEEEEELGPDFITFAKRLFRFL